MYCSKCGSYADNKFCSTCGNKVEVLPESSTSKKFGAEKFKRKFIKVYREIDYIEASIYKKEGWLFKTHSYSQEELMNSKHHKRVYSITEKIGDDVQNWHIRGKISEKGREAYKKQRDKVENKLHDINLKIMTREPTWWESMKGTLNKYIVLVMRNIPELGGWLLDTTSKTIAKLPHPAARWVSEHIATAINSTFNKCKRLTVK